MSDSHFDSASAELDPRRWFTLAIIILAIFIVVLDNSVLYVAIPTILREFDTTLPTLQWVVTGYSLTFATLLIIGGRLGDIYGHRRVFIIGAALFGAGSLVASVSTSVPQLLLGEAIIEGIGASLMMPATLAILSGTFQGHERATAFAMWGATSGVAVAFGPVIGGFLTTNYSWRWAFRINVIVVPIAIAGALLVMRRSSRADHSVRIDVPGALLVGSGMFLLVFGLSEGGTYGWLVPRTDVTIAGHVIWPVTWPISITPVLFAAAATILFVFVLYERAKERRDADPLFEFSLLRIKTFRWGVLTGMVLAMGQLALLFVLPVFLQDGKQLTAEENGFWLLPTGLFIIVGAQMGGRLIRRFGTVTIVRIGLVMQAVGILLVALVLRPDITFPALLPGFAFYGIGIGFGTSQLTNIVLEHIPHLKTGVVSGANTTSRQVGSALGVAVIGALLTAQTIRHATAQVESASLPPDFKAHALSRIQELGTNYRPSTGATVRELATLRDALESAVTSGARFALFFATFVVVVGAFISLLIPSNEPPSADPAFDAVERYRAFEAVDVDPALLDHTPAEPS